jgi:GNAT superfamily N-acetyltransferase
MFIERLTKRHDRTGFNCGEESLNDFIRRVASQQARRNIGVTYVSVPSEGETRVVGFYTLAAGEVSQDILPEKGPGVNVIPVVLLGRLAVDNSYKGTGLGKRLLIHALARAERVSWEIGAHAVVLDALTDEARAFYKHFGFMEFIDDPRHMYITIQKIAKLGLNPPG